MPLQAAAKAKCVPNSYLTPRLLILGVKTFLNKIIALFHGCLLLLTKSKLQATSKDWSRSCATALCRLYGRSGALTPLNNAFRLA